MNEDKAESCDSAGRALEELRKLTEELEAMLNRYKELA